MEGTYGVFCYSGCIVCYSFELPWLSNVRNSSCIPVDTYPVRKFFHSKFGSVFAVDSVRDRSSILIHAGNTVKDTRGCILPGLDVTRDGVLRSREAMSRLYLELPDVFDLTIKEV